MADLMAWNNLNASSVIYPGNRLVLQVTPPATNTPTLAPATETSLPSATFTPSFSPTSTRLYLPTPTATETSAALGDTERPNNWLLLLTVAATGAAVFLVISSQKSKKKPK
jgi:hypothetical protein